MGWRTVPPGTAVSTFRLSRSLSMRPGARGLRGVLERAWGGERSRRGRRSPRSGSPVLFPCALEPAVSAVCWSVHGLRTYRSQRTPCHQPSPADCAVMLDLLNVLSKITQHAEQKHTIV